MVSPKGRKFWIHRIQTKDLILFHLYSVEKVFLRKQQGVRISLIRLYIHIGIKMQDRFVHPKSTSQMYCPSFTHSWNRASLVRDTWVKHIFTRERTANSLKSQHNPGLPCYAEVLTALYCRIQKDISICAEKNCWKLNGHHGCEELLTAYACTGKYCALVGWDLESWCWGPDIYTILFFWSCSWIRFYLILWYACLLALGAHPEAHLPV